jgi:hypothetical protein
MCIVTLTELCSRMEGSQGSVLVLEKTQDADLSAFDVCSIANRAKTQEKIFVRNK